MYLFAKAMTILLYYLSFFEESNYYLFLTAIHNLVDFLNLDVGSIMNVLKDRNRRFEIAGLHNNILYGFKVGYRQKLFPPFWKAATQCGKKWKIYSHQKIFRQIKCLVISLVHKPVAFTKFLSKQRCERVNYCDFHTVSRQC